MQGRDDQGRFINKSESERKVRSIRATDSTWKAFGSIASQRGITRADLLEEMIRSNEIRGRNNKVVEILKDALKLKANAGGAIKKKIREVLDLI